MRNKIWIKQSVIDFIFENANQWMPKETGGILMGYQANRYEFVINDIIGPGSNAVHKLTSFYPDQIYHQDEIAFRYDQSDGYITYLGDWHTHPNASAYLSQQDKTIMKKIGAYQDARLPNPIMLIAAPPSKEFKIWVYDQRHIRSTHCYHESFPIIFNS